MRIDDVQRNRTIDLRGPINNSIDDYLMKLEASSEYFDVPLHTNYLETRSTRDCLKGQFSSNSTFVYPELLAMSIPSVATQFYTHTPPGRIYSSNVVTFAASQQYFERCSKIYYHNMKTQSNETLKFLIRRKIKYDGTIMTATGMKEELIVSIKNHDISVRSFLFIPIHSDDLTRILKLLSNDD